MITFDPKELKFPTYKGLESQYEHVVYSFLQEVLDRLGYTLRIKKSDENAIDSILVNKSNLRADGYIFNNKDKNMSKNLYALLELESNNPKSKLSNGIQQINDYLQILASNYEKGLYQTENVDILAIVYDGELLTVWSYNLQTNQITNIIGDFETRTGESVEDSSVFEKLLQYFPKIEKYQIETSEITTVNNIKNHLRANKILQTNKSYLMTLLAAMYGKKKEEDFETTLDILRTDSSDKESEGIYNEWEKFIPKIDYNNNSAVKQTIKEKLYTDAKDLWKLSQDKNMDLYGFIYEELAEEKTKQDEGEYYTSRHIIGPVISSVFKKYVLPTWGIKDNSNTTEIIKLIKNKKCLDPFCGSGGFLYETLRFFKHNYNMKDSQLDSIAKHSLYGFDRNDVMAAFLNMYLVGDGKTNLLQVTSTINWQNMWNYDVDAKPIKDKGRLKRNLTQNKRTFKAMLESIINWEKQKNKFGLEHDSLNSFMENYFIDNSISEDEYFSKLVEMRLEKNNVLKLIFSTFCEKSTLPKNNLPTFDNFYQSLGNIDLLFTNIPYGVVDDKRLTIGGAGTLESLSLKEVIDFLKPSDEYFGTFNKITGEYEYDSNGKKVSSNNGGIASVIVPNGILESENNKEIRDYLFKKCNVLSIIKLPVLAFAPYASIQTFIITFQKKAVFEFGDDTQKNKTFIYIVDNDGKANSKNRYPTKLIGKEIVEGKVLHEYLHDDFSTTLEKYPEGYLSKIERAWIFGNNKVDKKWNQKRITEKYDGKRWKTKEETLNKWGFYRLKKKKFEKRVEKSNKKANDFLLENLKKLPSNFSSMNFHDQKKIIIDLLKTSLVADISDITVRKKNDKYSIVSRTAFPYKKYVLNLVVSYCAFQDKEINDDHIVNLEDLKKYIIGQKSIHFPKHIKDLIEFFSSINEIIVLGDEISFYYVNEYEQYTLVPEEYLGRKEDILDTNESTKNILRMINVYNS